MPQPKASVAASPTNRDGKIGPLCDVPLPTSSHDGMIGTVREDYHGSTSTNYHVFEKQCSSINFLKRRSKVLCSGRNYYGQLSIQQVEDQCEGSKLSGDLSLSTTSNNPNKWICTLTETAQHICQEIKQIELGASHSMILTRGNELWVCGRYSSKNANFS